MKEFISTYVLVSVHCHCWTMPSLRTAVSDFNLSTKKNKSETLLMMSKEMLYNRKEKNTSKKDDASLNTDIHWQHPTAKPVMINGDSYQLSFCSHSKRAVLPIDRIVNGLRSLVIKLEPFAILFASGLKIWSNKWLSIYLALTLNARKRNAVDQMGIFVSTRSSVFPVDYEEKRTCFVRQERSNKQGYLYTDYLNLSISYWNKVVDAFFLPFSRCTTWPLSTAPRRLLWSWRTDDHFSRQHCSVPVAPHGRAIFTFLIPSDLPPKLCCDL